MCEGKIKGQSASCAGKRSIRQSGSNGKRKVSCRQSDQWAAAKNLKVWGWDIRAIIRSSATARNCSTLAERLVGAEEYRTGNEVTITKDESS